MSEMLEINDLESIIFSRLKDGLKKKFKKLTDDNFTTEEETKTSPKFPNIYVYLMPGIETGLTLERTVFEEGMFTFQIRVTGNNGQTEVKTITNEIIRQMKKMSFEITTTPAYENEIGKYWAVTRFRRTIGMNDVL